MATAAIWTVRAFEPATRRGWVSATRYHVIALTADDAIAKVRTEHERPELPETHGSRYTAESYPGEVHSIGTKTISAESAERAILVNCA